MFYHEHHYQYQVLHLQASWGARSSCESSSIHMMWISSSRGYGEPLRGMNEYV